MNDVSKYAKPETWATPDDFDLLMTRLAYALDDEYLTEDRDDPIHLAARCLLYAWQQGTVRIQQPEA